MRSKKGFPHGDKVYGIPLLLLYNVYLMLSYSAADLHQTYTHKYIYDTLITLHAGEQQRPLLIQNLLRWPTSDEAYRRRRPGWERQTWKQPGADGREGRTERRVKEEFRKEVTQIKKGAVTGRLKKINGEWWIKLWQICFLLSVRAYKDVEEGGAVVVLQDFFLQLLLNATVHLRDTNTNYWQKHSSGCAILYSLTIMLTLNIENG